MRIPNGLKAIDNPSNSESLPLQNVLLNDLSQYLSKLAIASEAESKKPDGLGGEATEAGAVATIG